jgi:CheY-like chemotaxis protein
MRILYVEDNPANLFLIKRVAKMGDHEVVNLIDGEEALRKIDMIKPDLILMDIQLAGQLTGLDVVRKLRSDGYSMPIVAVTAYAMVGDRERCLEAGCNEYLSKPLPIGRVVELLQLYQSGIPPEPPIAEGDSVNMPILPLIKVAPSEAASSSGTVAAPVIESVPTPTTPVEAPVVSEPTSSAEGPAPTETTSSVETPVVSDAVPPTEAVNASPAPDLEAKGQVTEDAGSSMSEDKLTSPQAEAPVAEQSSVKSEEVVKAVGERPADASESTPESDSTVEPTSQDTSHPQDTVQAQ